MKLKVAFFLIVILIISGFYFYSAKQDRLFKNYISVAQKQFSEEKYSDATASLTEAIGTKPNEPSAYMARAYAYHWNDQNDEALKDTDTHLSLSKNGQVKSPAELFLLRGDIFRKNGELSPALESYGMAYSFNPTIRGIVSGYSLTLIADEQYEKAYSILVKYFDQVSEDVYVDDTEIWLARGVSAVATDRCSDAIASAMHVLKITKYGDEENKIAQRMLDTARDGKECI